MMTAIVPKLRRNLVATGVLLGALVGMAYLQTFKLASLKTKPEGLTAALVKNEQATALILNLAQGLPTLGFDNLMADWFFLQFVQYFGDDPVRQLTGYQLSPNFFQVILGKDPFFSQVYNYLFVSVSLYAGAPEKAIAITDQALQNMSPQAPADSFYIWRNKAIDEFILLGDVPKAIASFRTAADWADQSPHPDAPMAAQLSRQTADYLTQNPDSRLARAMGWSNVIVRAVDDRSRQMAIQKVEEFGGQVTIENGAVRVFLPAEQSPTP